jgi:hypothetical protein
MERYVARISRPIEAPIAGGRRQRADGTTSDVEPIGGGDEAGSGGDD